MTGPHDAGRTGWFLRGLAGYWTVFKTRSGPERVVLILILVFCLLVPAAVAWPQKRSTVRLELELVPYGRAAPGRPLPYVSRLVPRLLPSELANIAHAETPFATTILPPSYKAFNDSVRVTDSGDGVAISGTADSAAFGLKVLRLLATEIIHQSYVDAATYFKAQTLLPALRRKLTQPGLTPFKRQKLSKQILFIAAAEGGGSSAGPFAIKSVNSLSAGLWQSFAKRLPGSPTTPQPLWPALAGLLFALSLILAWLTLVAAQSRRRQRLI